MVSTNSQPLIYRDVKSFGVTLRSHANTTTARVCFSIVNNIMSNVHKNIYRRAAKKGTCQSQLATHCYLQQYSFAYS